MLFLWFVLILTVVEKWLSMCNRNLHDYIHIFYPCPFSMLWASLQPENSSTIEMNTDWKSLQIYNPYIFMDLKRPLKLKRNCKTLFKVKCIQISCKKYLILDASAIKRSVLGDNVGWDLKMLSTIEKCPLHEGIVLRV